MSTELIEFVADLASDQAGPNLWNMYRDWHNDLEPEDTPALRSLILYQYLTEANPDVVLVGLAPGYAGARFSGVPFADEARVLAEGRTTRRLSNRTIPWKEDSASTMDRLFKLSRPFTCWNVIPFHPYGLGYLTNRTPDELEILQHGLPWLQRFTDVIRPGILVPVGRIAEQALSRVKVPDGTSVASYVRHPAHGGSAQFINGVMSLWRQGR